MWIDISGRMMSEDRDRDVCVLCLLGLNEKCNLNKRCFLLFHI